MTRRLLLIACAVLAMAGTVNASAQKSASGSTAASTTESADYVEGIVRVKLQPEVAARMVASKLPMTVSSTSGAYVQTGITPLDRVNQKVKAVSMTRVFPYAPKYEAQQKAAGLDLWYNVHYNASDMTPAQVRNLYRSAQGVSYAQRVPKYKLYGSNSYKTVTADALAKATSATTTMPFNDPLLSKQWHYNNDGSIPGTKAGYDINLFKAWEGGNYGSSDVIVAIIDGGFQLDHPDLADAKWINEAELNGQPGVDDDGDGYVDDIYGWNFVIDSSDLSAHNHGTHVAGTVGAINGNGIGVCGVAGGKDGKGGVKMMACQVFDSRSNLSADFAAAIVYAANKGASIAQCSWGYSSPEVEDEAVTEAVKYFTKYGGGEKMNGGLCIFASGNNSDEAVYYPGCLDDVVAVGSMCADGTVAYYTSCGSWVDVTAPGGLKDSGEQYAVLSTLPGSTYGYMEGTSMACPHVSGIAALILSKYGNPNFSNETLRTLLTTSVNDLYALNPDYEGKMGSGYIDAYKALNVGSSTSKPDAVSDLTITPSHNYALLEWTVPQCEDLSVDHHVLYYSTTPFTGTDDLSNISSVSIDTKFKNCGDAMQYELTGLQATTTYYFAMVAYNRWGNASAISEVKSATTNAGPKVSLDKTSLSMTVKAASSPTASASFNITNSGEGVLKYELTSATTSARASTSSVNSNPVPGRIVPFSGNLLSEKAAAANTLVAADYQTAEWPDTLAYHTNAYVYLGDTDTSLPNAMAQYFYVDKSKYPDGFNLTALKVKGQNGEDPEIEIYDGSSSISTATLLQKVSYSYWAYNYDINLGEQVYFAPGSSFWVVLKFPAGAKNPLAAGKSTAGNIPQYSFYSGDNGQSWTQLTEVLKGSTYESVSEKLTWCVTCLSKNPDWSKVLNPSPISGEVRAGEKQTVTLTNNGQQMVNGTYKFNIHVKSNEAVDSKKKVALTMTVSGNQPELQSVKLVDFGSLLVGESKTVDVEIANVGYGVFGKSWPAPKATSSSDDFSVASMKAIAARSKSTIAVTFTPTHDGDCSGTITLTNNSGYTYSFVVRGVASIPATLDIPTAEYDLGDLNVDGTEKTVTFTMKNTGKYPLQYVFPKFSSETIAGSTGKAHKFGYTIKSNVDGDESFAYSEMPELSDAVDITNQFNDNNWQSGAVKVGFKFPFYGTNYEQIHVTSQGGLAINTISGNTGCIVPTASCMTGLGYIAGFNNAGTLMMGANSKVYYGHKDGKLYVCYSNVLVPTGQDSYTPVSYHMVLSADGNIEIHYDSYDPTAVHGKGAYNFIGVCDIEGKDPFVFYDADQAEYEDYMVVPYTSIATGSAFQIIAPAQSFVKSVSSASGYISNGESTDITVTVAAGDNHVAGAITNFLTVLTNDPAHASANVTLKANIVGDGLVPQASIDSTQVDFGTVFQTSAQKRTVTLGNDGRDVLSVSGVAVKGGKFTVADDVTGAFTVAAGQSKDIVVTLPTTDKGAVEDVLVITYADATTAEVALKANVIGTPKWSIDPSEITVTTPYGENAQLNDVTVTNNGDEALTFSVAPEDWYKALDIEAADNSNSSVDYIFRSKSDGYDVPFEWIDITEDYTEHMPYAYYYENTDFKEVTLPFEFPFYGKKYSKMYIYDTGFVSFDETTDYKQFPEPPANLPTTDIFYRNIICPFWGNHSMNTTTADGVYYKAEDDRVIVTFKNYGNTMMQGMNYQVIINKDGSFKFQYSIDNDGYMIGVFGLTGIMDHTGTRGINPDDMYITPGNALVFYPYKNYQVAGGQSVKLPIEIYADKLADTYTYDLNVTTNDPQNESVNVPVSLTVTGAPDVKWPESIEVCTPVDPNNYNNYFEFEVVNNGSKAITITDITSDLFNAADGEWYPELQLYCYMEAQDDGGGIDPMSVTRDGGNKSWQPYYSGYTAPITLGHETLKFRVISNMFDTVHKTSGSIVFTCTGLDTKTVSVPTNVDITEAPALEFDKEEIRLTNVAADYTGEETLTMSNNGQYKLTYSLRLDPAGNDEVTNDYDYDYGYALAPKANAVIKPTAQFAKSMADACALTLDSKAAYQTFGNEKDTQKYYLDIPANFEYRTIYHPVLNPVSSAKAALMGTGADALDENYYAATRYEAPEDGFNLTHLYFTGSVGELQNVDIEAYVVLGNDVTKVANTIGHGKLHVESQSSDYSITGEPRMLEFDSPVYINPADTFYVVLKYPAGNAYSAFMASKDGDKESNRYMANMSAFGGWVDIESLYDQAYSYGAFGYFMTCVEREAGESWIRLLDTDTEGEVAAGESKQIKMLIKASSANFEKNNKATLVIKTNDPNNKVVNYHVYLDKNAAPVVTVPSGTITVPEAGTAQMKVTVADQEGDAFTAALTDLDGIVTIDSYTNADGTQEGITCTDGTFSVSAGTSLIVTYALKPNYGQAGYHSVKIDAADTNGNTYLADYTYYVEHTNRTPVYTGGATELTLNVGQSSQMFAYADLFTDPDGDEITRYTANINSSDVATLFKSETGFIVMATAEGDAVITVTATDANGDMGQQNINLTVEPASGINEVDADGAITVAATADDVYVTFGTAAEHADLSVYNNAGQIIGKKAISNVHAADKVAMNIDGRASAGVYHLVANLDGKTTVVTFAVK